MSTNRANGNPEALHSPPTTAQNSKDFMSAISSDASIRYAQQEKQAEKEK